MRRAYQDYSFWMVDDKFVGVSLGHDYCAEHEWGIEDMKKRFGIPDGSKKNMGVKNRQITKNSDTLVFKEETHKKAKYAILYTGYKYRTQVESEATLPVCLDHYVDDLRNNVEYDKKYPKEGRKPQDPLVTAWDGDGFGVGVMGEKEVGYLKDLYDAFQNNNVAIAHINLMPGNPFSNSSLSLLIVDRLPQAILDMMYSADKKHYDLVEYEEEIGMTKIKGKYGNKNGYNKSKYYMACSPRWINYEDPEKRNEEKKRCKTQYDIQYWINYSDDDNNCGWYTVEEIKEWLSGPKKLTEIRKG
jgi:hypothetical protein